MPRDGGNSFNGSLLANYTGDRLQSAPSLSSRLRDRGVRQGDLPTIKNIWDINGGWGGPIKRDRLWFFTAHRSWGSADRWSVNTSTPNPRTAGSTPDLRQAGGQ